MSTEPSNDASRIQTPGTLDPAPQSAAVTDDQAVWVDEEDDDDMDYEPTTGDDEDEELGDENEALEEEGRTMSFPPVQLIQCGRRMNG